MDGSLATRVRAANSALIGNWDLAAVGEFFAPDYVAHLTERDIEGHAAIRGFLGMLQRAFPDLDVEVAVLLEGEDRVAWQRTLQGTHQGDYMGFRPSGSRIVWR